MIRVLVCGGRSYSNTAIIHRVLWEIHTQQGIASLIQGGAAGADRFARNWARQNGIPVIQEDALWSTYGKSAGPIRNAAMLQKHKPDLVVAFPGGYGTANMIRLSEKQGVKVHRVVES